MTGISLAVEECPVEENLNMLTDSLSALQPLRGMRRKDFPLGLHRHTARHLLAGGPSNQPESRCWLCHAVVIKVRAHRAEPLNEQADTLAAEAAESYDSRPIESDLDLEAVHFLHKGKW